MLLPISVRSEIVPANDPAIEYFNYARMHLDEKCARFDRVIDAESGFRYDNPGVAIRFRTDSKSVVAKFGYTRPRQRPDVLNDVGVYFVDGKRVGEFHPRPARPCEIDVQLHTQHSQQERNIEILLPYGESVDFLGLVIDDKATMRSRPHSPSPVYIAYGDSITHGFRASDVTKTYPYLVSKSKGWQYRNMGFGSRQANKADGEILASMPCDVMTILMGFNDHYGNKPLARYREDVSGIIAHVRRIQPKLPLFVITPLWSTEPFPTELGLKLEDYRSVIRDLVAKSDDPNIFLIEGTALIPNEPSLFTDGVHPNDDGFQALAENLVNYLPKDLKSLKPRQIVTP